MTINITKSEISRLPDVQIKRQKYLLKDKGIRLKTKTFDFAGSGFRSIFSYLMAVQIRR